MAGLGDIFGARKFYMIGLVLFTIASLISGCASSMSASIAGRMLQGIGAALLVPCALSLLTHAYPDDTARAKAIASWAAWGGAAQVLGPLVGGLHAVRQPVIPTGSVQLGQPLLLQLTFPILGNSGLCNSV